jgi:hypothetical protein
MKNAPRLVSLILLCTPVWAIQNVNPSPAPSFEVASSTNASDPAKGTF